MHSSDQAGRGEPEAAAPRRTSTFRRGEVHDHVLAAIRHGLMVGAYVPGQVLSLRKLAASLGTSPMPVREALSQLVAANVLEAAPNRSVRVPRRDADWVRELTEVRVANEGLATRLACQRTTPALLDALERDNDHLIAAIAKRDIIGCLARNQEFHFRIYRAADSRILMSLIEALWLQCGPTMYSSLLDPEMPWDASAHTEVLAAMRRGDPAAASRAMIRDIRTTARNLLKRDSLDWPGARGGGPPLDVEIDGWAPAAGARLAPQSGRGP